MGGGSKSKAKACFEKAIETAKSDYDLYFAKIFLSQCYYEDGNKEKCLELLSEAEQIVPNGRTIAHFKLVNSAKNEAKVFSLEDFNNENDGLTRKEFIAKVQELTIERCLVNTGRELAYQDDNGTEKTRIEKLPKYTNVIMVI